MTEDERALLDFEEAHPRHTNRKEAAIREQFGIPLARYHQRLLRLIGRQDVVAAYPATVRRLERRLRESGIG